MKEFPNLKTRRLELRKIQLTDISTLIEYVNHKSISDNVLNIPFPYKEEDAIFRMNFILEGYKNKNRFVFAITLKKENGLIGEIGLHLDKDHNRAEMGFWLAEPFRKMGICTEAAGRLLKFGFEELALHKIIATHYLDNKASGKVLSNSGMVKEGELKDHYKNGDMYLSVVQYRMTLEEYLFHKKVDKTR